MNIYVITAHTNTHSNTEISSGTQGPATCFGQPCGHLQGGIVQRMDTLQSIKLQGGSNMTGTDLCVNKSYMSRSYLNHLVNCRGIRNSP